MFEANEQVQNESEPMMKNIPEYPQPGIAPSCYVGGYGAHEMFYA
jgi:hypothetical protein